MTGIKIKMLDDKFKIQIIRGVYLINNKKAMLDKVLKQQKKDEEKMQKEFSAKHKLFDDELKALYEKYKVRMRAASVVNKSGEVVQVILIESMPEEPKKSNLIK